MKWWSETRNLILQDMPSPEEEALGRAVRTALPSVAPSRRFVETLHRDLMAAAARQREAERQFDQSMRTLGLLGGGLLSLIGGVAIWALWQRRRGQAQPKASAQPALVTVEA